MKTTLKFKSEYGEVLFIETNKNPFELSDVECVALLENAVNQKKETDVLFGCKDLVEKENEDSKTDGE